MGEVGRKTRTNPPAAAGSATQMAAVMHNEAGGSSQNAGQTDEAV